MIPTFLSAASNIDTIKSALTGAFSASEVATVIAGVIGAGSGLVVLWFGARKLSRGIMGAFKSGKLKF